MSRRMDREGMYRMEPQGIINKQHWDDPRCVEDERGWVQPFSVYQGWEEFNRAVYALSCVLLARRINIPATGPLIMPDGKVDRNQLHRGMTEARVESDLRTFRFSLARSIRCDRPRLP